MCVTVSPTGNSFVRPKAYSIIDPKIVWMAQSPRFKHIFPEIPIIPTVSQFYLRQAKPKSEAKNSAVLGVLKGMAVGITGSTFGIPLEIARSQVTKAEGKSSVDLREVAQVYPQALKVRMPSRVLGNALFFGTTPLTKEGFSHWIDHPTYAKVSSLIASGIFSSVCTAPADKVVDAMERNGTVSFAKSLKATIESEGFSALWQGSTTAIVRTAVYRILFFSSAAYIKEKVEENSSQLSKNQSLINAAASGAAASLLVSPVSHFFFRLMAEQRAQVKGSDNPPAGMIQTTKNLIRKLLKQHGLPKMIPELFKGLHLTILRNPLLGSVTILTCELVNQAVDN